MSGDNFSFDITGASLELSMKIAFTSHSKAVGWVEMPRCWDLPGGGGVIHKPRLILFWTNSPKSQKFLAPMDSETIVSTVRAWLALQQYGSQPDHDGDNGKGWRVYNEDWGHVAGMWEAFVAIEPEWIMYGK